jgi:tRNA(Ile)-lysidine synthase
MKIKENKKVRNILYNSIDFNKPLVVCVSGGKDSIALLHMIMQYRDEFKVLPEVVHFNHGLRKESEREEIFIRDLCSRYGIKHRIYGLDVKGYAEKGGFSLEEAARILRYRKLEEYTQNLPEKGFIYTAHTSSDQLETVIFRIIKGTGRSGMLGIRREIELISGWIVRRPLLGFSAGDIKKYLKENKLKFCTDKSNFDLSFPRNFIRHKIIKYFKKLNPSVEDNVLRQVDIWAEEEEYLRKETAVELDYNRTQALFQLVDKPGGTSYIELGCGWKARKEYGKLIFEKDFPEITPFEYEVVPGEEIYIKEIDKTLKVSVVEGSAVPDLSKNVEIFDAGHMDLSTIRIRSRKKGDRMTLWGMKGRKKVKDICIDSKMPVKERAEMALLLQGEEILWAAPYRRSDLYQVKDTTGIVLKAEIT